MHTAEVCGRSRGAAAATNAFTQVCYMKGLGFTEERDIYTALLDELGGQ